MTRHTIGLALFGCLVLSSCKSEKATTPTPPPPEKPEPVPEPPAVLEIGGDASVEIVSVAFAPDAKVTQEAQMAEGETIGKMYRVEFDGDLTAVVYASDADSITSIEYYRNFTGPGGVEPGVSSFAETDAALALTDCVGGADDSAERIFCRTKMSGLTAVFPGNDDTPDLKMSTPTTAKAVGEKPLLALGFAGPADPSLMKRK